MTSSRALSRTLTATLTAALSVALALGGVSAAQAQSLEQTSADIHSQAQAQPVASTATQLADATRAHLDKQGHRADGNAQNIAQEWAHQGAAGEIQFVGTAGDGTTHLNEGSGNVYKLTAQEAADRIAWLNRDVPVIAGVSHGYGVAAATDGTYVYVAEYFRN